MVADWTTPAVFKPHFSSEPCIASNLFPGAYFGHACVQHDGTALPDAILADLRQCAAAVQEELHFGPGDFVIVDNTRFLHGRAEQPVHRRMHVIMGALGPWAASFDTPLVGR